MFSAIQAPRLRLPQKFFSFWTVVILWGHVSATHGQTVIRETVTLTPGALNTSAHPAEYVYVASDSGTYWGRIGLARKYSPIAFGPLTVTYRDTTYVFDTRQYVVNNWSQQQVQYRCEDPETPIWYTAYYAYDVQRPLRFFLPDVHAGDTLRFSYSGVAPSSRSCFDFGMTHDVCISASDQCYVYFEGALQKLWICAVQLGVLSTELAAFRVAAGRDTVSPGRSTPVRAIAVDSSGTEVPIDSTTVLTYRLMPETSGAFIDARGDTLPSPLSSVLYGEARAGRVRFLAADSLRDSMFVLVEVVQSLDTSKRGRDTIWIKNQMNVMFTRLDSVGVYPYYPAIRNDTVTAGLKKCFVDVELKVITSDSTPVPNTLVEILRPALVDSGGHSHNHTRPTGTYRYPIGSTSATDTVRGLTDSTGRLRFRYVASQFGGVERITARLVSDTTRWDTLSVKIKVPGLALLPQGTKYVKVGGTCTHHGPSDNSTIPDSCRSPDNNHWGTNRIIQAIQKIGVAYDSIHRGVRLRINDMSLPSGGLFDVSGNWQTDHKEHREGVNADIGYTGLDSLNQYVQVDTTDIQSIIRKKTNQKPVHHRPGGQVAPHFHMYVKRD